MKLIYNMTWKKGATIFGELFNNSFNLPVHNRFSQIATNFSSGKSVEEKIGLPPKPKKPLTPYFKYMQRMRPIVAAENPRANVTDIVKILANKWKTVDNDLKKKLEDEYKKEQISYVEKSAKYESKLTESQKTNIKQLKREIAESKERRLQKKRIKELGRPKKPLSAFFRYVTNERSINPPTKDMSYIDWVKKMTEKWSRLSDAEKEKYKTEARKELEKYKQEYSKWENEMIKLGHTDVVRQSALIDPKIKSKEKL